MMKRLISYSRGLARRRRIDQEVDDELQFHLDQEIAGHVARGIAPAEARRMALRDLGGLTQTREAVRDVRTLSLDLLWRDLRHAVRALRATPSFTAVALTVVTLSIGALTAIFSVVDAVVLRGLPFDKSDRLVAVGEQLIDQNAAAAQPAAFRNRVAPQNFFDWREQQDVFTAIAGVNFGELTVWRDGDAPAENLRAPMVTADFFRVLRVAPLLGRGFTIDDQAQGSPRVAVISYSLWQRRFGGDDDVIGRFLRGPLAAFEIVGVMPPGFAYPVDEVDPVEAWVPYIASPEDRVRGNSFGYNLQVIGRLRDGVSIQQAQARMDQITAALAAATPRWFTDRTAHVEPLHEFVTGGVRSWMLMLLGAVSVVLLIACVNLANLMLVRGTTRTRELGVRAALGASRWDLARGLLLESLLLSLAGAALGTVVAWWGVDMLRAAMPADVPRVADIAVDLRVLAFTAIVAMATGVAFGLAPVVQFSRPAVAGVFNPAERISTGNARTQWLRGALVVAEVALAVVLLVGSALFLTSFARVIDVDLGLDHRDVLTVQVRVLEVPVDVQRFSQRNRQLLLNVLDRVQGVPGVERAALLGGGLPLRGDLRTVDFAIPGRVLPRNTDIALNQISPDYFSVMRVPVLKGRTFTGTDARNSPLVVILNQAAASRYFPGQDPIGQVVRVSGNRTVVGIVGDVRHDGPERGVRTQAFVPITQNPVAGATLVVRTTPDARGVLPAVRQAVWAEFPDEGVPARVDDNALGRYFDGLVAQRRLNMLLLALFGGLGLLIAAAGIYGVLSSVVTQRTPEIGVRMALGALPSSILVSVVGGAMIYLAAGLAIGLASAWGLAELVRGFLFDIQPHEPAIYAAVFSVLLITGLAAAFWPARRAVRIDPLVALRVD